jgi:hypothetical protein
MSNQHALKKALSVAILLAALFGSCPEARAWGSYGHQQVNVAALELFNELLRDSSMGKCMKMNDKFIQRLAITPDYDWKKLGTEIDSNFNPVDPKFKTLPDGSHNPAYRFSDPRIVSDDYEHPLHYFEADAFIDPIHIGKLPSGPYSSVAAKYTSLRFAKDRAAFVLAVDPSKATTPPATEEDPETRTRAPVENIDYVRSHGTAPWRIKQLYDLGVAQLKAGNVELALVYLGAMGHYVGDMSQPFHTSLNFDGTYDSGHPNDPRSPVYSSGIHATFETEIFKRLVPKDKQPDAKTFLYPSFEATDSGVLVAAHKVLGKSKLVRIPSTRVVREVFRVISTSTPYVQPLLDALWTDVLACPAHQKDCTPKETSAMTASKSVKRSPANSLNMSVIEVAEQRIAESAVLLARLWYSASMDAFDSAPKKALATDSCEVYFDGTPEKHPAFRRTVVTNYPKPLYLPIGHQQAPARPAFVPHLSPSTLPSSATTGTPGDDTGGETSGDVSSSKLPLPSSNAVKAFMNEVLK